MQSKLAQHVPDDDLCHVRAEFGSTISFGQPVICEDEFLSVTSGIEMTGGGS